jgi:fumarylpyruvate hydrolase
MAYTFMPPEPTSTLVAETLTRFAIHRVYGVDRQDAVYADEKKLDKQKLPVFFCKPADVVAPVDTGQVLILPHPKATRDLHVSGELVIAIGRAGSEITPDRALTHVWGYAVGMDLTRYDLLTQLRQTGRSWDMAKAFVYSAPMGPIYPALQTGHFVKEAMWLAVNGQVKQNGRVSDLTWNIALIISELSKYFRLELGDLIFTGISQASNPVVRGDTVQAGIDRLGELTIKII